MAEVKVNDPDMVVTKEVDEYGRVSLGQSLANRNVEIVVTVEAETEDSEDE